MLTVIGIITYMIFFCFHVLFHLFLRINITDMHYYYLHFTKPRPGEIK